MSSFTSGACKLFKFKFLLIFPVQLQSEHAFYSSKEKKKTKK